MYRKNFCSEKLKTKIEEEEEDKFEYVSRVEEQESVYISFSVI